jgi:hypothetical protein
MTRLSLLIVLLMTAREGQAAEPNAGAKVDFRRQVRPILSDACFHCHGPDQASRVADLRLDRKEDAFRARKNGTPVVAGKPNESLLLQRVAHAKKALRMPPPSAHKELSEEQIGVLRRWIEQGADWEEHWSFIAPRKSAVPETKAKDWAKGEIDRFLLARLEAAGLQPAGTADRRTLARRVSLDLTGLPPSPAEVAEFLKDESPAAYERYVDRLLASPHYGEHRARYWLDAARYADTHGLHIDNYREMWPYRDWLIASFNQNQRFDSFSKDQLAGDLLPQPTQAQLVASGFHRNNVTTNEGGVIEDEVAAMYAKDRVDTTSTVFLGLTLGCATCHDHKFDPLLQKDFYAMSAFFRNTTQKPLDGNISDTPPVIFLPTPTDAARWAVVGQESLAAWGKLGDRLEQLPAPKKLPLTLWKNEVPVLRLDDAQLANVGQKELVLPNTKAIRSDGPFSISLRVFYPAPDDNWTLLSQYDGTEEDGKKRLGWSIDIQGRQPLLRMMNSNGDVTVVRADNEHKMKPGNWYHLVFTYDGAQKTRGAFRLYYDGVRLEAPRGSIEGSIANSLPLRAGGDGGKRKFKGGKLEDVRIYDRVLSAVEVAILKDRKPEWIWAANKDRQFQKLNTQLLALDREFNDIVRRGAVTHVMVEKKDTMPMAAVLYRGQYDQPRDKVQADVPSALPGLGDLPRNRIGLAAWLLKPENPLFARVTVNRFWQEIFGTGLVRSSDDFGSQGEAPSHPELLDWLAVDFRENGWDVKRLMKQLVTSAAYQQQALTTEDKRKADPDNRLLSRGPRFRMDGEVLRDYALAASGLLVRKIGGPSVRPYQPEKIWETVAMEGSDTRFYVQDHGEKLYRRSLYTFWKRSAPPPGMDIFNAPTRENCVVRRERTNTPLQALLTMNDVQFVEAARVLAGRAMLADKNNFDRQLDYLTEHLLSRRFEAREREVTRSAYKDYLRHYDSQPADAQKLLAVGESKAEAKLAPAEFAALTMVANQLMNLDEVLSK